MLGLGVGLGSQVMLPLSGGTLLVQPALTLPFALGGIAGIGGAGAGYVPLALPSLPALLGVNFNLQAAIVDPGVAAGLALTAALEVWIG